jgi:integral membrane protein (TIGR01906 family)
MPKWLTRIVQIAVGLALPLVLLIGNIQLLMHPRFVDFEYGRSDFPADTALPAGGYRLSRSEREALAETALRSITGTEGMRALEEARFQETDRPAFNAREIRHMRDVRWLFQRARAVFWVALGALLGGTALLMWEGGHRQAATRPLLISIIGTLSLAGAAGVYILLNFRSFFTSFHHTFFEGDTWLFRPDDTLIRLFPTDFWSDAALIIAGLTIVELVLVGAWAWWWERRKVDAD